MIGIIAAIGKNNELGKDNKLIWHIPDDMKFFKKTTLNHKVIMGLNTYNSLPKKGLLGREMIVLTKEKREDLENVKFVTDINKLIEEYIDSEEEVFIIGGASIYEQFLPYAKYMYLTEIDLECIDADVFFPKFNKSNWNSDLVEEGNSNNIDYKIYKYIKKR